MKEAIEILKSAQKDIEKLLFLGSKDFNNPKYQDAVLGVANGFAWRTAGRYAPPSIYPQGGFFGRFILDSYSTDGILPAQIDKGVHDVLCQSLERKMRMMSMQIPFMDDEPSIEKIKVRPITNGAQITIDYRAGNGHQSILQHANMIILHNNARDVLFSAMDALASEVYNKADTNVHNYSFNDDAPAGQLGFLG